jgi:hypothetical protein
MTEQENIQFNLKGEIPSNGYEIVQIRNINNAKEVLENFKNTVLVFLENKDLNNKDPKWEELLPQGIVSKIKQLDDDNFKYDELLDDVDSTIYNFQEIRDWEWHSSLEVENGFDIIVEGYFNVGQFISFIHCQNVPLANIRIIKEGGNKVYELMTFKDYTTYKVLK